MGRAAMVLREGGWEAKARRLARALSPVAVSPAAPREMVAALDAWGPSLVPRSARVRGVAMGLGILGARATSAGVRFAEGCFDRHLLREDPVSPLLQFRYGGRPPRRPPDAGLGVQIDPAALKRHTVDQARIT